MKVWLHLKKPLVVLNIALIISLFLSACEVFPDMLRNEAQRQLDSFAQQQKEILRATAQAEVSKLQATAQARMNDLPGVVTQTGSNAIQTFKEWLGLTAPSRVGIVSTGLNTQTSPAVIETAFKDAYQRAGGGKSIGYPDHPVHLEESNFLVQDFSGGSQNRSIIVMKDGDSQAYYVPGEWLKTYKSLGGLAKAGYPISNPFNWGTPSWQLWSEGRGQRQSFLSDSGEYALMRASGSDSVHILPPDILQFYEDNQGYEKIGYPLSSYPIQDDQWHQDNRISRSTKELLTRWEDSPFRAQVFEKGGILMDRNHTRWELVEGTQRFGVGELKDSRFMLDLSSILMNEYDNRDTFSQESCFNEVLQHAAYMSNSSALTMALGYVSKMIIGATLSGVDLVAESAYAKISIFAAQVFLEKTGQNNWPDAIKEVMAGDILESIYTAGIGEILSKPAAEVSQLLLQSEYDRITHDRYTNALRSIPGRTSGLNGFRVTMDVSLVVAHDPLLNMVSGVMTSSQCAYAFYFKFDPGGTATSGHVAPADQVWDGRVHFIDLATGADIR